MNFIQPDQHTRRAFLRRSTQLAIAGTAMPFALNLAAIGEAAAFNATDYKALVCVFLFGGNDYANTVVAYDEPSYNAYSSIRGGTNGIALTRAALAATVLSPTTALTGGLQYTLNPAMTGLAGLFNSGKAAVQLNVGPLVVPLTKTQYASTNRVLYPLPPKLFSHNDQQNTWQALGPEGTTLGWGGRMGDMFAAQNARPAFTAISATGNAVWLAGDQVRQYQVNTTGAIPLGVDSAGRVFGSATVGASLQRLAASVRSGHPFDADLAAVARRAIDAEQILRTALRPPGDPAFGTTPATGNYIANNDPKLRYDNPLTAAQAPNTLAQQLQVVARLIDAGLRGTSGTRRQVFFVSVGGFDTHDLQNRNQADLMARVAHALQYFDTTLGGLGARNNVTTFSASDFGRTFTSNGDGTDHGWGSHHLVMGGAVRGGDLYGRFPTLSVKNSNNNNFDGSPDQLGNGSLLPTTSVDQLGATLGRWMGLSDAQTLDIFPNLASFDASTRNLGFLGA